MPASADRGRDHLANERTFLAWVRTGVAFIVFGFAIGRFAVALTEISRIGGTHNTPGGVSLWLGVVSVLLGIGLVAVGWIRYDRTRKQIESGEFTVSVRLITIVTAATILLGLVMAAYLVFTKFTLTAKALRINTAAATAAPDRNSVISRPN
jgi:putative membrane protein